MSTQALSAPISSLSPLLVQTQAARWKTATPEQLTGAHLYLDISKSGYLFHAIGNVMQSVQKLLDYNKRIIKEFGTHISAVPVHRPALVAGSMTIMCELPHGLVLGFPRTSPSQIHISDHNNNNNMIQYSGKTSYRKISWSLEAARFVFRLFQSLWNLTAMLPRCLSNFRTIRSL